MNVEVLGSGSPEISVVGVVHGDEPCGKKAIDRFLESGYDIMRPVKLIVANQRAYKKSQRYVDKDLNRCFPGDKESDAYEERLAAKIVEEVKGTTLLDIHSTRSFSRPFGIMDGKATKEELEIAEALGLENVVYFPEEEGTLVSEFSGLNVECGLQNSGEAAENAYYVLLSFLAANDVIEREPEFLDPEFFRNLGAVDGDWEFTAENFRKVERGEKYAEAGNEELRAEKDFYPVLMSTNGYEDMLGFRAEKITKNKILKDCSSRK